jgi:hypothetical protein
MIPKSTGLDRPTEPLHPLAVPALDGGRNALKAEIGATLERQLLLAGEPQEDARPAILAPWVRRLTLLTLLLAAVASGVFFFVQSRRTWEGKVAGLEEDLRKLAAASAERERALLHEQAAKDLQIAERKAEIGRIAALADDTLRQLRTSLDDFRKLREEKVALEREYRETLRREQASLDGFLQRWVPRWARPDVNGPEVPQPEGLRSDGLHSTES